MLSETASFRLTNSIKYYHCTVLLYSAALLVCYISFIPPKLTTVKLNFQINESLCRQPNTGMCPDKKIFQISEALLCRIPWMSFLYTEKPQFSRPHLSRVFTYPDTVWEPVRILLIIKWFTYKFSYMDGQLGNGCFWISEAPLYTFSMEQLPVAEGLWNTASTIIILDIYIYWTLAYNYIYNVCISCIRTRCNCLDNKCIYINNNMLTYLLSTLILYVE